MEIKDSSQQFFELYKFYVELTDKMSQRRGQANVFFLSVLSTFIGLTGFAYPFLSNGGTKSIVYLISVFGILLCFVWYLNINSYKQINKLRFTVIQEMEISLVFPCFSREWQLLKEKKMKYTRLSKIEKFVPLLFIIPFVFFIIINLI